MIRVHELVGEITGLHAGLMQGEWFDHEKFSMDTPVLWDLRNAKIPKDYEYLSSVVGDLIRNSMKQRPAGRASIVISTESDLALLCRAYKKSVESGRILITRSMIEARDWLVNEGANQTHCRSHASS